MTDQQNQTAKLTSNAEPTATKSSYSVVRVSQRTAEHGIPKRGNDSKAPSDKRAKKSEKLAALEKDFASKMRLKKIEFELKRKELEMEIQLLEEEDALKLEFETEALDAKASDSDDSEAPSIRSRSPFNWKTPKNKDVSGWLNISRINSPTCTIIVWSVRRKPPRKAGVVEYVQSNDSPSRYTRL